VSEESKKPFFLYPPWNILFEVHRLEKLSPWNVDISFLLLSFLGEMDKRGEVDFRASGVALDSSAFIYLMKSKLLLKLEEPVAVSQKVGEAVPPPLFPPLRYEGFFSTTIKELLEVLDEALKSERLLPFKPRLEPILPPPPDVLPEIDLYLMAIEEQMEILYDTLLEHAVKGVPVRFSVLVEGFGRLEAIKTFIILLFLAQRRRVGLWQDVDFSEIYITLKGDGFGADGAAGNS